MGLLKNLHFFREVQHGIFGRFKLLVQNTNAFLEVFGMGQPVLPHSSWHQHKLCNFAACQKHYRILVLYPNLNPGCFLTTIHFHTEYRNSCANIEKKKTH